mmetsp:Transcript_23711/g.74603  ORF Transcript_23711/g.74603 Transcript_23711/m.74603 type:complete len:108 (-) Transcript_23711:2360-2683(-)
MRRNSSYGGLSRSPSVGIEGPITDRGDLQRAVRVVVKAGTAIIADDDGYTSLRRISNIVEECARLQRSGKQVILVSSGAVGVGRNVIRRQSILAKSAIDHLHGETQP